jgi:hypothetical protein
MKEIEIIHTIESASKYDPEYLYFLLGNKIVDGKILPQSAGDLAVAGKIFFAKWKIEFQRIICKKDGVANQFEKGMIAKKDVPKLAAIAILTGTPVVGGVILGEVIAAYLALLIVQAGLRAYCSGFDED